MKRSLNILVVFICLLLPLNVFAMDHGSMGHDDGKKGHDMSQMDHGSMKMDGEKISLGEVDVDGVKGTAYLLDVSKAMATHGMKTTHHLMINFTDVESGEALVKGRAATKVIGADGKESKALKMMTMDKAFGTDLTLDQHGVYQFRIGTKLNDEKKRTFSFKFDK